MLPVISGSGANPPSPGEGGPDREAHAPARRPWACYALAAALCLAALLARYALGFAAGEETMLVLYTMPVIVSAYAGGLGPGLFATALATLLANYFLMPPLFALSLSDPKNIIQVAVMLASGAMISALTESLHRSRRRAEATREELRKTRSMLANILESMPSAVVGIDRQGLVTHWNRAAEELSGHGAPEALGKTLEQAFPWFAARMEGIESLLSQKRTAVLEKQAMAQEDGTLYLDVLAYPLVANGTEGVVLRMDDVTRRVHMEEIMMQTEKMRSMGSLAGGMAHEINNPLAGILQSAQNLRRRLDPGIKPNQEAASRAGFSMEQLQAYLIQRNIPECLDIISQSGERAARIVRNMLGFARKGSPDKVPASLPEIVDNAVEIASADYDLKKKYDFRRVELVRDYQPDMPPVPCSPSEIEQVVFNLLQNAAHALDGSPGADPPRITLRIRCQGGLAVLQIQDNGPGMDEAVRRKAFEPLFTTKGPEQGTGLGLPIAYHIVTGNHGGTLTVDSAPGQGATFTIALPLSPDKPGDES